MLNSLMKQGNDGNLIGKLAKDGGISLFAFVSNCLCLFHKDANKIGLRCSTLYFLKIWQAFFGE